MNTEHLVPVDQFCSYHEIEISFVRSLHESGLIGITIVEEVQYIPEEELSAIEKMIRMHYELGINLEGIETITHLLQQVDQLQQNLTELRNRLRLYEE